MAPKVPKKTLASIEKPTVKTISKTKKTKKNRYNYSTYIYRILRTMPEKNTGIRRKSMSIMNSLVNDMLEKTASEAGKLAALSKKKTLSSREVQTAVKLVVPGELAAHANMEAMKAVTMYINSHDNNKI